MPAFISCRVSQLARALGVTPVVIYRWVERGLLPNNCIVRDGRSIFILGGPFAEFVAAGGLERSYLLRRRAHSDKLCGLLDTAIQAVEKIGEAYL